MIRVLPRSGRIGAYLSLFLIGIAGARSYATDLTDITWHDDFQRAEFEAKAKTRPIWIQFTGPWCHYCVRMERETFKDPKVAAHAKERFVTVKLRSDVHERLALSYGLTSLPATVIVKPNGEVIAKREGFAEADEFRNFLQDSLNRAGPPLVLVAAADKASGSQDDVALAGYCPVSLVMNRRLVPGQSEVSATHEGRVYRFANDSVLKLFQRQPERYIPVCGGRCPVAVVDRGEFKGGAAKWGVLYRGHLYLCGDEASQKNFLKNPSRYAHVDMADRGFCPHCWGRDQLLVRGRPQFSVTRGGQVYLFPDLDHLSAFRTSSDRTRR